MPNANRKGKDAERELSAVLRTLGFTEARRGVQYEGGSESPDVVAIPGIHIECKRDERRPIERALVQSVAEAGESEVPIVCSRRNRQPWLVTLPLLDVVAFARAVLAEVERCEMAERGSKGRYVA